MLYENKPSGASPYYTLRAYDLSQGITVYYQISSVQADFDLAQKGGFVDEKVFVYTQSQTLNVVDCEQRAKVTKSGSYYDAALIGVEVDNGSPAAITGGAYTADRGANTLGVTVIPFPSTQGHTLTRVD